MNGNSSYMILAVALGAFIAGYSIVSYLVKKLRGQHATLIDQDLKEADPTAAKRSQPEDQSQESDKT